MPTTITAQNGKAIKQSTKISVSGCPLTVLSHHVRGHKAIIAVKVPAAGSVSARARKLRAVHKHLGKAQNTTLTAPLSSAGLRALASHRRLAVRVHLGFVPKAKGKRSSASVLVVFK
jgi:hypothetical protein